MKTIRFSFKQTGFNAHIAKGKFTYDTPKHARQAAEDMKKKKGFSRIRLTNQSARV